jgi:hypothetical protein
MRLFLTISAIWWLASCTDQQPVRTVTKLIVPDVPKELREPVPVPARQVTTLADVGVVLADHVEALDAANGRITATDCILKDAEAKAAGTDPAPCPGG